MARTSATKTNSAKIEKVEKENIVEENKIDKKTEVGVSPELGDILAYMKQMQEKIDNLETALEKKDEQLKQYSNNTTEKLLETLVNSKSNREVTIVHNAEMFNGLCTAMELSNLSIKLTRLGEQRVLSWQQFEEMVSKYRGFINKGLIKVTPKDRDLCDKYQIQCYEPDEEITLTETLLKKLPDMDVYELENTYKKLSEENQKVLLSYWLGKCYAREEDRDDRFYDRYKIDALNRLSNSYLFDNIIADMNSTYAQKAGINK